MRSRWSLDEWLAWQETLHWKSIDLGLERVLQVARRLRLGRPAQTVISIAGTNGKGSCAGLLDVAYRHAGYRVGMYTSPHLQHYSERIQINGTCVRESDLCTAFMAIDQVRNHISLTYFEFGTLAALWLFARQYLDIAILEVGLGGRLDAVNIVDADLALLTRFELDHSQWLGARRGDIAQEKAGIMRAGKPVVCGDHECPTEVLECARNCGAPLWLIDRDFAWARGASGELRWRAGDEQRTLGWPAPGSMAQADNAASCRMVLSALHKVLPVPAQSSGRVWEKLALIGRCTPLPGQPNVWLDVAHNADASKALADFIAAQPKHATTAIFGIMGDKDCAGVIAPMLGLVGQWIAVDLPSARALDARAIAATISDLGASVRTAPSVEVALQQCGNERVIVFGSFYTVAGALSSGDRQLETTWIKH